MIEELWDKGFVISFESEEEYIQLRYLLHELGFKWNSGTDLIVLSYLGYLEGCGYLRHDRGDGGIRRSDNYGDAPLRYSYDSFMREYAPDTEIGAEINIKMLFDKE